MISHNIRGLNIPERRSTLLRELKKGKPQFVFLQETHFKTNNIPKLTSPQFPRAFHATTPDSKSKGVTILIGRDTPFKLNEQLCDPEGRFVFLKGTYNDLPLTLANVYFPNKSHITFCQLIVRRLQEFADGCIILGGDFNVPLNPLLDTSNGRTCITYKILKKIKSLLHKLQLVDSWRFLNPDGRDYTHFSIPHNRYARLDCIFVPQRDLSKISAAKIGTQTISDHAPISLTLDLQNSSRRQQTWRLNTSLLSDPTLLPVITNNITDFFKHNNTPGTDPLLVWEAHKCTIRGVLIGMGSRRKKEKDAQIRKLLTQIESLEVLHKQSLSETSAKSLLEARKDLQQILHTKAKRILFFKRRLYYESGDKAGRFLARALKEQNSSNQIVGIRSKEGKLEVKPEAIANHFHAFYTKLYNLPPQHKPPQMLGDRTQLIQDYIRHSGLPSLPKDDTDLLEAPFTTAEVKQAIKLLKPGKSPGPDGYSATYYKSFMEILTEPLKDALNALSKPRRVTPGFLSAHIAVIPKEGKNPEECASYRPISLLNLDAKLFAKIIALRMGPLLSKLIGLEQVGFMPNREARDNVTKALLLTQAVRQRKIEGFLLSTDAEKAFDRVAWDFMLAVCGGVGLGPNMLHWISALYQNPTAELKINGILSEKVYIKNGTRQGCPLSPLLFILSLEPFIRTVQKNTAIQGFQIKNKEYKLAAYADDLLFFLTKPTTTLPNLLQEFAHYGFISNLKINYTKSEALNLSLPDNVLKLTQANSTFTWDKTKLKYLGIWLTPSLKTTYERNFVTFLKNCAKDLTVWNENYFSWFGRAAIVKMVILPRFLYLTRTLPIEIPQKFFNELNTMVTRFLWQHKKPRIKLGTLVKPKDLGGIQFPNFRSYYQASHITRIIDWHCHESEKDWVSLESTLATLPLRYLPWSPIKTLPHAVRLHPITGTTLKIITGLAKQKKLTSTPSPLTPLTDNPDFTPGLHNPTLKKSPAGDPLLAGDCYNENKFRDWSSFKTDLNRPQMKLWTYFQLRSYLGNIKEPLTLHRPLTALESVCREGIPIKKATSVAYEWMSRSGTEISDGHRRRWSEELELEISDKQWRYVAALAHKCSISTKLQETNYKLLTHWYSTPDKIHKWDTQKPDTCWRCLSEKGTLAHIWWHCHKIEPFWNEVKVLIKKITETKVELTPACCLLHLSNTSFKRYKRSLTIHLLNAAKSQIPLHWLSTSTPTVGDWLSRVSEIHEMEDVLAQDKGHIERFHKTWQPWLLFKYSAEFPS